MRTGRCGVSGDDNSHPVWIAGSMALPLHGFVQGLDACRNRKLKNTHFFTSALIMSVCYCVGQMPQPTCLAGCGEVQYPLHHNASQSLVQKGVKDCAWGNVKEGQSRVTGGVVKSWEETGQTKNGSGRKPRRAAGWV